MTILLTHHWDEETKRSSNLKVAAMRATQEDVAQLRKWIALIQHTEVSNFMFHGFDKTRRPARMLEQVLLVDALRDEILVQVPILMFRCVSICLRVSINVRGGPTLQ